MKTAKTFLVATAALAFTVAMASTNKENKPFAPVKDTVQDTVPKKKDTTKKDTSTASFQLRQF